MKKPRKIEAVIRGALDRHLAKMQEKGTGYLHDGWTGVALASWVAPGVIRAVKRHLAKGKKP